MEKILVVCDSRGKGLERALQRIDRRRRWDVIIYKGKGMMRLVDQAIKSGYKRNYSIIIIMGGICDLTMLSWRERFVRARLTDSDETVEGIFQDVKPAIDLLRTITGKVLIAATYGVDLMKFNTKLFGEGGYGGVRDIAKRRADQRKVDYSVDMFNKRVAEINANERLPTIRLGNKVHHRRRSGEQYTTYKLLDDGCHPGDEMVEYNATLMCAALDRMEFNT